jgi:hypothetical protein
MILTAIGISLFSLHMPYEGQDQFNPGIHMEAGNVRAGFYRNSNTRSDLPDTTTYLGYSLPVVRSKSFRVGINVALAHGYRSPVIGSLEFRLGSYVVVNALPPVKIPSHDIDTPAVLGFMLRIPTSQL